MTVVGDLQTMAALICCELFIQILLTPKKCSSKAFYDQWIEIDFSLEIILQHLNGMRYANDILNGLIWGGSEMIPRGWIPSKYVVVLK